jgi:uncharacterized membrane protein
MTYILRALRLLAMMVWVGGLIFFAFIEAPTAFHVMGTTRQFALLIGGSVEAINRLGQVAAVVFLVASFVLLRRQTARNRRLLGAEMLLVALMMATTAYVQMSIVPAMERDRTAVGGDVNSVPPDNPARVHFEALHARSERVEGTALFLGLGVILVMAGEESTSRDQHRVDDFVTR